MLRSTMFAADVAAHTRRNGDTPRVIRQFTSIFLVSQCDELWRVYDSDVPDGADRRMPAPESTSRHRLFLGLARKTEVRVYAFADRESHAVDAASLQMQLDRSTAT